MRNDFGLVVFVLNVLINMYCKCGSIDVVNRVFFNMIIRDLVLWNIIIGGLVRYGKGGIVFKFLKEMVFFGVCFNFVILILVFLVCSYLGFVNEGFEFFNIMIKDLSLIFKREYFVCLVDMLVCVG